ncbi:MAG: NUDIX hydrolase [Rhodospirillales bacterium]|nr:NUDIX hydrolase [Rhodospirillales bacterium]
MPRWTVQYVYLDETGNTRVSMDTVEAESKDNALTLAAKQAPAEEFMITLHPESEEQLLGSVRHKAMAMAGKIQKNFIPTEEDEGDEGMEPLHHSDSMSRTYPNRPIAAVGIVIIDEDRILLVRRTKPPRQGRWSLPGGVQETGETVFEAARREVLEETGITVEIKGLVDVVDSIKRDDQEKISLHYTLIEVVAVPVSGKLAAASDADEADWFPLKDISDMGLWSETVRIIRLAREKLNALNVT